MKVIENLALSIVVAAAVSYNAIAEDYVIDTKDSHASVEFKATHLGYSYVAGRFNTFEGTFSYDEADPASASVSVTIDVASVDTNHAERDKHLKSGDFFDVGKFPTIAFNSTSVSEAADDRIAITGDLDLHGVTQSVTLDGRHIGHGKDPWGGYRRGLEATTTVSAEDFGMPDWVGDVEIRVIVEGIKQ